MTIDHPEGPKPKAQLCFKEGFHVPCFSGNNDFIFPSAKSPIFNTSLVMEQILSESLYTEIAFVGPHLSEVVASLNSSGNPFVVLHYHPSELTLKYNLTDFLFPPCSNPLTLTNMQTEPQCLYAPRRMAKVYLSNTQFLRH